MTGFICLESNQGCNAMIVGFLLFLRHYNTSDCFDLN